MARDINFVRELYTRILKNVREVVVGREEVFSLIFTSVLSGGHVLIEDNPGTGKTTLAKAIAASINAEYRRVQFTPDLMPQDITGLNVYSQKDAEFHLIKGPVFTNIMLADEINRATPRTQSSLLEAMEERQVTIDGERLALNEPFIVIATENPVETTGTYPLPEAQLDRFMMKISMSDLSTDDEVEIINRYIKGEPLKSIKAVATCEEMIEAREIISNVHVAKCIMQYVVDISNATREHNKVVVGVSPRASLVLVKAAQAFAAISGRNYVTPDDIKFLVPYVYSHRMVTYMGQSKSNTNNSDGIINDILNLVTVPVEDWEK